MGQKAVSRGARAGGLVRRRDGDTVYLLVTARGQDDEWVIPKGHVEPGETPEQAARREVREEAGVEAVVVAALPPSEFDLDGERVRVLYYLLEFQAVVAAPERGRHVAWCRLPEALARLSYPEGQAVLRHAHALAAG